MIRTIGATVASNISASNDQVIVLAVDWPAYESLSAAVEGTAGPRLAYDGVSLELMSPSSKHEVYNRLLEALIRMVAAEWAIEILAFGSTTLQREPRGAEPDSSFYVGPNADLMLGVEELDLGRDPAPDIVVEIDLSRSRLKKQSIYAAFEVSEYWRYDGSRLRAFALRDRTYHEISDSLVIGGLSISALDRCLELRQNTKQSAILAEWQQWLRQNAPGISSGAST